MAEGPMVGPSGADQPSAQGIPPEQVTFLSWQAEMSSVLPPSNEIQAYERSIPNAGERLLRLVEREVEHRHTMERHIVKADNFRANLGLIAGILMALGVTSASLTAIFQGKQIGGIVGIGATAALIGTAFRARKPS
jgi:uncharacterized membrane protein